MRKGYLNSNRQAVWPLCGRKTIEYCDERYGIKVERSGLCQDGDTRGCGDGSRPQQRTKQTQMQTFSCRNNDHRPNFNLALKADISTLEGNATRK
jgi:hypothetical protein